MLHVVRIRYSTISSTVEAKPQNISSRKSFNCVYSNKVMKMSSASVVDIRKKDKKMSMKKYVSCKKFNNKKKSVNIFRKTTKTVTNE